MTWFFMKQRGEAARRPWGTRRQLSGNLAGAVVPASPAIAKSLASIESRGACLAASSSAPEEIAGAGTVGAPARSRQPGDVGFLQAIF